MVSLEQVFVARMEGRGDVAMLAQETEVQIAVHGRM
jgi:hypothetical protein